jgi:hypothetical protein
MEYMSRGDLGFAPPHATWKMGACQSWFVLGSPRVLMIGALRSLNESVSGFQYGTALAVSGVAMALMHCAVIWQANLIAYQRDLIRFLSITGFGSM